MDAAEAHHEALFKADCSENLDDQKRIARLEAGGANNTATLTATLIRPDELAGKTASTIGTSNIEEQESTKPADDRPFPFMKLPVELRMEVYKAHLILPGRINVHEPSHRADTPIDLSVCMLWAVSRTTYKESIPVFFRSNSFHYEHLGRLTSFLECIRPVARRNLESISIHFVGKAPARAMKLLKKCIGLRRLTIKISRSSLKCFPYRFWASGPLTKLHGMADLLQVRGIENLTVSASSDLVGYFLDVHEVPILEEALQVLKQPHKPGQLTRQENQDYPQKATRTVLGKANVKTRAEQKLTSSASS